MATIGLKYPVFAPLTETGSTTSYTDGVVLSKAISADISITVSDVKLFGDDDVAEEEKSFEGGTITETITHLSLENKALILGHELVDAGITENPDLKMLVSKGNDEGPYGGHGFYAPMKENGVRKYRAIWLTKVRFSEPDDNMETKGETVSFQTPTVVGEIYRDVTGTWKKEVVTATEADAIAWLNGLANITPEA